MKFSFPKFGLSVFISSSQICCKRLVGLMQAKSNTEYYCNNHLNLRYEFIVCSKTSNENRRPSLNILVARCCHTGAQWQSTPSPMRGSVYRHSLSAVMNFLSNRSGRRFISSTGKRKMSQVWEYSSYAETKLQSVVFVSQSGILNLLEFLLVSSTTPKSKSYASWEHSSALFHRGWRDILSPHCCAWRKPSAFWYSLLNY